MDDSTKRRSHQTSSSQVTTQPLSSGTSNLLTGQPQGPRASLPTRYHQATHREPQTEEEKQAATIEASFGLSFAMDGTDARKDSRNPDTQPQPDAKQDEDDVFDLMAELDIH